MVSKNIKINLNFYINLIIIFSLFFGGIIWADTNGIWQDAKDIRGGTFGLDEQLNTTNFIFINNIFINSNLTVNNFIETRYPILSNHVATKKYVDDKKEEIFSCYRQGLIYNGSSCICSAGAYC